MKVLIIKKFQDTPDTVIYPVTVVNMWPATAERAVKEGKALPIPDDVDGDAFKIEYELKNKKGK